MLEVAAAIPHDEPPGRGDGCRALKRLLRPPPLLLKPLLMPPPAIPPPLRSLVTQLLRALLKFSLDAAADSIFARAAPMFIAALELPAGFSVREGDGSAKGTTP